MIIVKLKGGLGNQMFQWALGRALAHKHNTEFKIDVYFLLDGTERKNFTPRNYDLDIFKLSPDFATKDDLSKFKFPKFGKYGLFVERLKQKFYRRFDANGFNFIIQTKFDYDEQIAEAPPNSYIEGYFQTELYFKPIEDIIREDFRFRDELVNGAEDMGKAISSAQSVAVHIRRGDYVTNPKANKTHGLMTKDYYKSAFEIIESKVESPHYFVFSDDNDWCRQNFDFSGNMTLIEDDIKGKKFQFSLRLMSMCKHAIVANSSFSWWGAWLNPSKERIVIGPQNWFASRSLNSKDVMPHWWLKI